MSDSARDDVDGDGSLAGWVAGVAVACLIAQNTFEQVIAGLSVNVSVNHKFAGIDAEFVVRHSGKGVIGAWRKIDGADFQALGLNNDQLSGNKAFLARLMGVDVHAVIDLEVEIDDAVFFRDDVDLLRIKKAHGLMWIIRGVVALPGQLLRSNKAGRKKERGNGC